MTYKPGLHILAELRTDDNTVTRGAQQFKSVIDELIARYSLSKVGEVYHDFENGGYTAVICLTESHISVHTWPEFGVITFDVFLSNFMNDNEAKVEGIYQDVISYFNPQSVNKTAVTR